MQATVVKLYWQIKAQINLKKYKGRIIDINSQNSEQHVILLKNRANGTHSSILAWEIPWTEEPGGLQSMGSQRVRHDLVTKQQQQIFPFLLCEYCMKLNN